MDQLIKETLIIMRQEGRYISYLFPFSIPYYRKKGWEIICDIVEFQVKIHNFHTTLKYQEKCEEWKH